MLVLGRDDYPRLETLTSRDDATHSAAEGTPFRELAPKTEGHVGVYILNAFTRVVQPLSARATTSPGERHHLINH